MSARDFAPTTETELARFVAENAERADGPRPLFPVGGRTSLFGTPPQSEGEGVVVTTAHLADVVDYPARDMTITVGAGVRIDDLQRLLAEQGQCLPLDVPQSQRATLGGVIASNTSGPRRFGFGTIRDHVIGIAAVDGVGRLFHAGGRVVKNVAGYDLCKMLVGSRGQLAILTTVTLKLRPTPARSMTLWFTAPDLVTIEAALERLGTSSTRPVIVDVLTSRAATTVAAAARPDVPGGAATLVVGYAGTAGELDWQAAAVTDELAPLLSTPPVRCDDEDARSILNALVDFQTRSEDALVVKATVRASRTIEFLDRAESLGFHAQAHAANGIVYAHLDGLDAARAAEHLRDLRTLVAESGGSVAVHGCDPEWLDALDIDGPPAEAWSLMQRLKQTFDPHGILNPIRRPAWAALRTARGAGTHGGGSDRSVRSSPRVV